jgi:MFS family permease
LLGLALLGMCAGSLIGLPLSGVLTARFGSRKTTTAALLAMLLATPLPILAPLPPLFAIALGLLGMANGAVDVAMNTLLPLRTGTAGPSCRDFTGCSASAVSPALLRQRWR